jgi:hypothetical protein
MILNQGFHKNNRRTENLYFSNLDFILKTARSWTFLSYKEQVQSLSFAPLPNPLLRGEGKGIT